MKKPSAWRSPAQPATSATPSPSASPRARCSGKDQPVILQLLEVPVEKAQKALKGVAMELDDCAFPLLQGMVLTG
jgi:hypothetical protein